MVYNMYNLLASISEEITEYGMLRLLVTTTSAATLFKIWDTMVQPYDYH